MFQQLLLIMSLVMLVSSAASAERNPRVHDPTLIASGGYFYLYCTGHGIPAFRSRDMVEWDRLGSVFANNPSPDFRYPWAPDISFFNGKYHLYYAVSTFGTNRSYIGLAENSTLDPASPEYRWTLDGKVIESTAADKFNAIDPSIVMDEQHVPWMVFGSCWSGIKLRQLDPQTGKPAGRNTILYDLATRPRGKVIEGPALVHKGGYYYLFVSFDLCCKGVDSTYKIMVGRSRIVTGPYTDMEGRPMLEGGGSLVLAGQGDMRGPGGNSVMMATAGRDWIVNHFYDAAHHGVSRLQVRPIVWDEKGWPLAGEPLEKPPGHTAPPPKPDLTGAWNYSVDFGDLTSIQLNPDGKISDSNANSTWALNGNQLILNWSRGDGAAYRADHCMISDDGQWFVGRDPSGRVVRGTRGKLPP